MLASQPCRMCAHSCTLFSIEDFIWQLSKGHHCRKKSLCSWWCGACGGQYDWREANSVLTIQASCRLEDTWVCKAHALFPGPCDTMISALKLLENLQMEENSVEVVYEGLNDSRRRTVVVALTQFMELDIHKALVFAKLLDQHLWRRRWWAQNSTQLTTKMQLLRKEAFVDTPRIDRRRWRPPLVFSDLSALCQTLYDGLVHED